MKVLVYLLVPILVVTLVATVTWLRNRQPTSLESGVESFRREMEALSPESGPVHRRPGQAGQERPTPPRRPPARDRRD